MRIETDALNEKPYEGYKTIKQNISLSSPWLQFTINFVVCLSRNIRTSLTILEVSFFQFHYPIWKRLLSLSNNKKKKNRNTQGSIKIITAANEFIFRGLFLPISELYWFLINLFVSLVVSRSLWTDHVLEWWNHKDDPNVLFLKFEDLQKVCWIEIWILFCTRLFNLLIRKTLSGTFFLAPFQSLVNRQWQINIQINITRLRIPTGGKQTSWLFTRVNGETEN